MYLIGISGGSGSGKTTFANKLINMVKEDISILHMDSYYLNVQPQEHYTAKGNPNYDHPAAFDWELLRTHLSELKRGNPIEVPVYDFVSSSRLQKTTTLNPSDVIVFEGIFSIFDKEIRELLDIRCFLHVDADIRIARRINRDVNERGRTLQSVIAQYYETVRPMYNKFLAPQKDYADFIIGEETDIAASILSAKVNELYKIGKYCLNTTNLNRGGLEVDNHQVNLNHD
ncbi:uridine kinase [Halobacteriovorax marinus SJ]|uniref:Uridine kinase n=1 Tax=Halobacteriovorax marinus (strain ATCC BAA-682 / DSM 15412 / SJ) TaxID=862908 RepID=E1X258_HALMS|nr:uridine kinase [Halobacteriovorax marinus]CBW25014.1 uridine kinase [Halobacteriovorax marinus SJ]